MGRKRKRGFLDISSKERHKTRPPKTAWNLSKWHTRDDVYNGQTHAQRKKKHRIKGKIPIVRDLI